MLKTRTAPQGLLTALGFLSRVAPATVDDRPSAAANSESRVAGPASIEPGTRDGWRGNPLAASVPWFPVAGIVLGMLATALPWCGALLFPAFPPAAAAWVYVAMLAFLTRGLHWDALADISDACGSNATGERFWAIMKDSRVGAFGVLGLIFGVSAQLVAATLCAGKGLWIALVLAPVFGRAMIIPLGRLVEPAPQSWLARTVLPGTQGRTAFFSCAAAIVACALCVGLVSTAIALVAGACALIVLRGVALRQGGGNGDFCGTIIIAGETALLLGVSVAG